MGVPRLYPWITQNFKDAIKHFQQGEYNMSVDYLYLDANSFLHGAAQEIFNYGTSKRKMDPYRNSDESVKRKKVFSLFFEIIIQITQMMIPRKVLYIAIDGPAPLAKQNQQRERRFSRAKDRLQEESEAGKDLFDSSCISEGTLISVRNGLSRPIENLCDNYTIVNTLSDDFSLVECVDQTNFFDQGEKETICLVFEDGSEMICTPDHRISTPNGWIEAQNLKKDSYVLRSLTGVKDIAQPDEQNWTLNLEEISIKMNTYTEREKALTFSRILGFALADGCVGSYLRKSTGIYEPYCSLTIGGLSDVKDVQYDIKLLTGQTQSFTFDPSRSYRINVPAKISRAFIKSGIPVGKRIDQSIFFPNFILEKDCPLSILREFLAGYFGGDGHSPGYGKKNVVAWGVAFSHGVRKEYLDNMNEHMETLVKLLERLDVKSTIEKPQKIKENRSGYKSNAEWVCKIHIDNTEIFSEKVGFRYCQTKTIRLDAMERYFRMHKNINKQRYECLELALKIYNNSDKPKYNKTIDQAVSEYFTDKNPPIHPYSIPSDQSLGWVVRRKCFPQKLNFIRGLKIEEYMKEIGADKFFRNGHSSGLERESKTPVLKSKLVGKYCAGKRKVYDISVDSESHTFFANGIAVHNCMTPGTVFMLELTRYMNYAIRKEMNSYGSWKNIEVYFSPATTPSEGEHKCLQFIRELPAFEREKSTHCFYGNDGDLIMLGLASHVPNMYLFREDMRLGPGHYDLLDIGMIRKNITKYLPIPPKNKTRDHNDTVDDFIVLGFFVGNDFLPKIQMFHLGNLLDKPLEYMIKTYIRTSKGVSNFLVIDGKLDLSGFKVFVNEITQNEERFLIDQIAKPPNPRDEPVEIFKNVTLAECVTTSIPPGSEKIVYHLDMEKYREKYYQKCGLLDPNSSKGNPSHPPNGYSLPKNTKDRSFKESLRGMCHDYLKTLTWVFQYYIYGLPSWRWAYEHHYAPLMADFNDYLQSLTPKEYEKIYTFDLQSPSLPFEQLLSVLPTTSADLLPNPYRKLMTNPQSPLVKLGYYPKSFEVDYEGKIREHEGIVILPFVNYDEIHKYYLKMTECCVKDPKKFVRNTLSRASIFRYDKDYSATFTSDMGNIDHLHVRKTFV